MSYVSFFHGRLSFILKWLEKSEEFGKEELDSVQKMARV